MVKRYYRTYCTLQDILSKIRSSQKKVLYIRTYSKIFDIKRYDCQKIRWPKDMMFSKDTYYIHMTT